MMAISGSFGNWTIVKCQGDEIWDDREGKKTFDMVNSIIMKIKYF